jgi:high-affinity nickel permease
VVRNDETARLRDAYLLAEVVGPRHAVDAHHIALATVWRVGTSSTSCTWTKYGGSTP